MNRVRKLHVPPVRGESPKQPGRAAAGGDVSELAAVYGRRVNAPAPHQWWKQKSWL